MRFAFISDVHGNLPALEAVLKKIGELSIDKVYFLGDAVGYGPWPKECVELLMRSTDGAILGNHDAGVVRRMDISEYYDAIRYVLEWSRHQLDIDSYKYLEGLKYMMPDPEGHNFLCSHGSPRKPEWYDYILNLDSVEPLYEVQQFLKPITFLGHSHYCSLFVMTGKHKTVELGVTPAPLKMEYNFPVLCVVGSVGQPRDGDTRASFVTYDTDTKMLQYHRVEYDVQKTASKIIEARLPRSFADRLLEGC